MSPAPRPARSTTWCARAGLRLRRVEVDGVAHLRQIDEQVTVFRTRKLDHTGFPCVYLDATYVKARVAHHITSRAVVVATGVAADGNREVLGVDVGDSEDEVFWTVFLRSLRDRGLSGVRLVVSDAHSGLKAAIGRVLQGAGWQRCKVHLMRNLLAHVPKAHKEMVAATVRTIFAQPDPDATRAHLRTVADTLAGRFPRVAELLLAPEADVTAYADFPRAPFAFRKVSDAIGAIAAEPGSGCGGQTMPPRPEVTLSVNTLGVAERLA